MLPVFPVLVTGRLCNLVDTDGEVKVSSLARSAASNVANPLAPCQPICTCCCDLLFMNQDDECYLNARVPSMLTVIIDRTVCHVFLGL